VYYSCSLRSFWLVTRRMSFCYVFFTEPSVIQTAQRRPIKYQSFGHRHHYSKVPRHLPIPPLIFTGSKSAKFGLDFWHHSYLKNKFWNATPLKNRRKILLNHQQVNLTLLDCVKIWHTLWVLTARWVVKNIHTLYYNIHTF